MGGECDRWILGLVPTYGAAGGWAGGRGAIGGTGMKAMTVAT